MNCPYCNEEMQHGVLRGDGRSPVRFDQEGRKLSWSDKMAGIGVVKLKLSWGAFRIEADYCEKCRKIILGAEVGK